MSRIFAALALFAIILLAATMLLGLPVDLNDKISHLRDLNAQMGGLTDTAPNAESRAEEKERIREEIEQGRRGFAAEQILSSVHKLVGIAAALIVVLVCSIAVTYFVGTSRWCREVVEAYELNGSLLLRIQKLKRRAFPWAVLGMCTVVVISAFGAASDPGTGLPKTADWVMPHLGVAFLGTALIGYCFYILWDAIVQNHTIIESVMHEVHDVRVANGLETESDTHAPLLS